MTYIDMRLHVHQLMIVGQLRECRMWRLRHAFGKAEQSKMMGNGHAEVAGGQIGQ